MYGIIHFKTNARTIGNNIPGVINLYRPKDHHPDIHLIHRAQNKKKKKLKINLYVFICVFSTDLVEYLQGTLDIYTITKF